MWGWAPRTWGPCWACASVGKAGTAGKAGVGVLRLPLSPVSLFSGRRVLLAAPEHSCLSPLLEQDSVKLGPGSVEVRGKLRVWI